MNHPFSDKFYLVDKKSGPAFVLYDNDTAYVIETEHSTVTLQKLQKIFQLWLATTDDGHKFVRCRQVPDAPFMISDLEQALASNGSLRQHFALHGVYGVAVSKVRAVESTPLLTVNDPVELPLLSEIARKSIEDRLVDSLRTHIKLYHIRLCEHSDVDLVNGVLVVKIQAAPRQQKLPKEMANFVEWKGTPVRVELVTKRDSMV